MPLPVGPIPRHRVQSATLLHGPPLSQRRTPTVPRLGSPRLGLFLRGGGQEAPGEAGEDQELPPGPAQHGPLLMANPYPKPRPKPKKKPTPLRRTAIKRSRKPLRRRRPLPKPIRDAAAF